MEDLDADDEQEQTLEKTLPSHQNFYEKFDDNTLKYDDVCTGKMTELNNLKSSMESHAEDVMNAACYVHTEYEKGRFFTREACYFLYFWIGQQLFSSSGGTDLQDTLHQICTKMMDTKVFGTHGCKDICDKVEKTTFGHMKSVFDFLYDHTTTRALLTNGGSKVIEECKSYKEKVKAAETAVGTHCENDGKKHNYCQNFWTWNSNSVSFNLSKLETSLTSAHERIEKEEQAAKLAKHEAVSQAVRGATTTSSISSIFGTLAATAFPFLLYKYKPWFSWFGNYSSGNGRSRKRRAIGRNFSSSTEDTLTEYSTETSTIGRTENSTVRSSVTTCPRQSTQGQSTRRRNNNAGGRGMVGYQNM
ncbi:KIR protein [Plasmodium coatneyi]|uniref:KIR protein n=1 Tax=Plasmodium coatneyi TaxID=208452 RepID=A0A1B1DWK8_9APIC|nr:KIR protein [Plasmodium coatneyi]ANQ07019.1 KIR protein [Plasmodium coatneyi]